MDEPLPLLAGSEPPAARLAETASFESLVGFAVKAIDSATSLGCWGGASILS